MGLSHFIVNSRRFKLAKSFKMADGMSGDQEFLADEVKIIMKDVSHKISLYPDHFPRLL